MTLPTFLTLDFAPMATAAFCAATCAMLGSWLLLRRMSLLGDAISHSVLPGLVAAFVVTQSRSPLPMFLGGATAGVVAAALIELVRRAGKLDSGTAMGVVFSASFALGLVMIRRVEGTMSADLDADCVLYGELSRILWQPPAGTTHLSVAGIGSIPREFIAAGTGTLVTFAAIVALRKELTAAAFDHAFAVTTGLRPGLVSTVLVVLVAASVVSSFEAVGSILVIALLVCPAAAARFLTDRLGVQLVLSVVIGVACAVLGYILAAAAPEIVGLPGAVSPSGSIAVCTGGALVLAILAGPRHGVIARGWRWLDLASRVAAEDRLARLYRESEATGSRVVERERFEPRVSAWVAFVSAWKLRRQGLIENTSKGPQLTGSGLVRAAELVRAHRLWESYLVENVGLRPDHVHDTAMRLEHLPPRLEPELSAELDPHNRPIPPRTSP